MIEVSNVNLPLGMFSTDDAASADEAALACAAAQAISAPDASVASVRLLRRSIDARKKRDVHFVATLAVVLEDGSLEAAALGRPGVREHAPYEPLAIAPWPDSALRPVVVGTGPAGLFAALYLARAGARPLVVERGAAVGERSAAVAAFDRGGGLDPQANIQFGEGGAGTFSDGKLTTSIKNPCTAHVLRWFVEAGAPRQILWEGHPHIGSDRLPSVVEAMRREIIARGGEVRFRTQLVGLGFEEGVLSSVSLRDGLTGLVSTEGARCAVLATGHSARDTFALLRDEGFAMERKPFSLGVRIEHPQGDIDRAQWGAAAAHPALGAAEYKMAVHLPSGRSVYTFCMCPGGTVACAASEEGGIVVNGMSDFARDGRNANAALLVNVDPADLDGDDVLAGIALQEDIERRAYGASLSAGGLPYQAPAQRVGSFLGMDDAPVSASRVAPTYARGTVSCDLRSFLPAFVAASIAEALPLLDRRLHGFCDPDAVMTAPETRSSSPVRVMRDEAFQARRLGSPASGCGVYPCGEGAGYAGGIMSAAVDGLRIAEAVVSAACAR